MSKFEKLMVKLFSGTSDNNFDFGELLKIVESMGFVLKKVNGSHHIFYMDGLNEIIKPSA